MNYDLKEKIVLITGANRGIGKALVDSFIESGVAKIYAAVRTLDNASPLVEKYGDKVVPIHIDLTEPQSILVAAETATDVQVVVNNAGVLETSAPLNEDALTSLEFEININVYGLIRMAQAFAPVLKANGGGVFAQLNSVLSMKCISSVATYSASKAASYSITQALRELLAEQGTIVLSVHPGPMATDMIHKVGLADIADSPLLVAEAIIEALKTGDFHVFPGTMAKQIGEAYQSFAENIVLANLLEE